MRAAFMLISFWASLIAAPQHAVRPLLICGNWIAAAAVAAAVRAAACLRTPYGSAAASTQSILQTVAAPHRPTTRKFNQNESTGNAAAAVAAAQDAPHTLEHTLIRMRFASQQTAAQRALASLTLVSWRCAQALLLSCSLALALC